MSCFDFVLWKLIIKFLSWRRSLHLVFGIFYNLSLSLTLQGFLVVLNFVRGETELITKLTRLHVRCRTAQADDDLTTDFLIVRRSLSSILD